MSNRSSKTFTCFAAAVALVVLSSELSVAEDGPQMKMDPKFMEMLSTFQKKVVETSDAIIQNMKKDTPKNGTYADQGAGPELSMDRAYKFMETLSDLQKKATGTTKADNQNIK